MHSKLFQSRVLYYLGTLSSLSKKSSTSLSHSRLIFKQFYWPRKQWVNWVMYIVNKLQTCRQLNQENLTCEARLTTMNCQYYFGTIINLGTLYNKFTSVIGLGQESCMKVIPSILSLSVPWGISDCTDCMWFWVLQRKYFPYSPTCIYGSVATTAQTSITFLVPIRIKEEVLSGWTYQ